MRTIGMLLLLFVMCTVKVTAQSQKNTKDEVALDLEFLKNELELKHPNLYTYCTPSEVNHWFGNVLEQLPDSISNEEAFGIVSSISGLLKDGHSYIYPSAKHLEDFFSSAPLFPLDVFLIKDELIVVGNFSKEQSIPLGSKLIKINGLKTQELQDNIVQNICRDGDNVEYPKHLFYKFFPAYYSFFYGFQKKFEIDFLNDKGELKSVIIDGLPRSEIKIQRSSEGEMGIDFQIMPNQNSALLTIRSFSNKTLKSDYSQKFKKEVKRAFILMEEEGIQHLAIDLRDNQGGEISNGIFLLQYFMTSSFRCVNSYQVLKKGKKRQLHNRWDNYFEPKKKYHFDGSVYLFINGGSFSCSSLFANTFKENKRGSILGEMTGGSAFVNSGAPNETITLPNTSVIFTIPRTQYILRENILNIGLGVIPDIKIEDSPSRFINDLDNYVIRFEALIKE